MGKEKIEVIEEAVVSGVIVRESGRSRKNQEENIERLVEAVEARPEKEGEGLEDEVRRLLAWYRSKKSIQRTAVRRASELIIAASGESIHVLKRVIQVCAKGSQVNDANVREASCDFMADCLEAAYMRELHVDTTIWKLVVDAGKSQLFDSSQACRAAACRTLRRCQDDSSREALRKSLSTETSKAVRLAGILALEPVSRHEIHALLERTRDIDPDVRKAAWDALRTKKVPPHFQLAAPYLTSALSTELNPNPVCLCLAFWSPSNLGDLDLYTIKMNDPDEIIVRAARGLARLKHTTPSHLDDPEQEDLRKQLHSQHNDLKLSAPSLHNEHSARAALLAARADLLQPYRRLPKAATQDDEALEELAARFDDDSCLNHASALELAALLAPNVFDEGRRRRLAELLQTNIMTQTVSLEYADAALRLLDALGESDLALSGLVWVVARQGRLLCKSTHPEREHATMLAGVGEADPETRRIALIGLGRAAAKHGGARPGVLSLFKQVAHNTLEDFQVRAAATRAASDAMLAAGSISDHLLFTHLLFAPDTQDEASILRDLSAQALAKLAWRFRAVSHRESAEIAADLLLAPNSTSATLSQLLFNTLRTQAPDTFRACAQCLALRFSHHNVLNLEAFSNALTKLQDLDPTHDDDRVPGVAFVAMYEGLALLLRAGHQEESRLRDALAVIPAFDQREANVVIARLAAKCGLSKLAARAKRAGGRRYHASFDPRGLVDAENFQSDEDEKELARVKPRRTARAHVSYHEETNDEKYFAELRRRQKEQAAEKTTKADDDIVCSICGSGDRADTLLLCDGCGCDKATHFTCLDPPLTEIPEGDWFCTSCLTANDSSVEVISTANASAADGTLDLADEPEEEASLYSQAEDDDEASI